ncbi:unnamed protein product [Peronospora belbahrii]|uniref:PARG catalytic Macro domain-containing protein n=1 Tax=Peronospora belbahrii TaxID=622444 RepID=A0AAU9KN49_9STRA|nr:unnamed protein product [Peronospora belbahrii]
MTLRLVTRYWLHETLRLGRWLRPNSNPFFEPPPRPKDLWLQYPIGYQDATGHDEVNGEKDMNMQDSSARSIFPRAVRLPCSPKFCFRGVVPLWPYIAAYLAQPIRNVHELAARLQLLTLSHSRRRLNCLEYAVNELLTTKEQTMFFKDVLPEMTRMVLALPQMFATPPPLLIPQEANGRVNLGSKNEAGSGSTEDNAREESQVVIQSHRFSKLEVLTLVCGCFFGIFPDQDIAKSGQILQSRRPRRQGDDTGNGIIQFPHFTAVRMFSAPGNMSKMVVLKGQKICCLLQYFLRVVPLAMSERNAFSTEVIDFARVAVHLPPFVHGPIGAEQSSKELFEILKNLSRAHCASQSAMNAHPRLYAATCVSDVLIEDLDKHLQVDFANKFAGGGVLSSGCVQEEIRFLLSPELLVSCLVFAKLEPHEAFVVHGTERYSTYEGYGGSFVYGGNFKDTTRLNSVSNGCVRRECVIVGIDATDYGSAQVQRQYERGHVWRDLLKAYAGFAYPEASDNEHCWPVASGNWGCGVFQGDRELKFLIQWLAASLHHRDLVYVLFQCDLDFQTKVNTLLRLVTSLKSREWDQQCGGVIQWLMDFLFHELRVELGESSVLTRAILSLERALVTLDVQDDTKVEVPVTITQREEQRSEAMKKKPKIMKKTFYQTTMEEIYKPK